MLYTNMQFRSILNGLGFRSQGANEPNFPVSNDDSPMTDSQTVQAIEQFQTYFHFNVDGIAGPQTMATAQQEMITLHTELNQLLGSAIPNDQPYYGPITVQLIQQFEGDYRYPINGIASLPIRQELYRLTHSSTTFRR